MDVNLPGAELAWPCILFGIGILFVCGVCFICVVIGCLQNKQFDGKGLFFFIPQLVCGLLVLQFGLDVRQENKDFQDFVETHYERFETVNQAERAFYRHQQIEKYINQVEEYKKLKEDTTKSSEEDMMQEIFKR